MTRQDVPLPPKHADDSISPEQAEVKDAARCLQQHQQERRERLFRQVGDNADDHYLRKLMTRYQGG
jgi:hypothetical protein